MLTAPNILGLRHGAVADRTSLMGTLQGFIQAGRSVEGDSVYVFDLYRWAISSASWLFAYSLVVGRGGAGMLRLHVRTHGTQALCHTGSREDGLVMGPDKRISTMPTSSPGYSLTQGKMAIVRVSRARLGKFECAWSGLRMSGRGERECSGHSADAKPWERASTVC